MLNDDQVVIENKNVTCEYIKNKLLKYNENEYINIIDLVNNSFIRENDEYKIVFSFNDNNQIIRLKKEEQEFNQELFGQITINDNTINIKYNSSLENKEIIIHLL